MGEFDFTGNNFVDIEKAKQIKTKYDAVLAKMVNEGYSEELYEEYADIKKQVEDIDPQIVLDAGINLSILDVVNQKHQEHVRELEKMDEDINKLNHKYVQILESYIINHDENSKNEIEEYINIVKKSPEKVKSNVYNNTDVFKAITNAFVKKEKAPKVVEKTGLEIEDLSFGLDLKDKKQIKTYQERLITSFTSQIIDKVHKLVQQERATFSKKGYIRIANKKIKECLFAETLLPNQIAKKQVSLKDISGNLSKDKNNKVIFVPKLETIVDNVKIRKEAAGIGKCYVYILYDAKLDSDVICNQVLKNVNQELGKKELSIRYGLSANLNDFIGSCGANVRALEEDEIDYKKTYSSKEIYLGVYKKSQVYEYSLKSKYENVYEVPYFFEIRRGKSK